MMTEQNAARDTERRPSERAASRSAKTKLTEVVVVCAKCAKRQGLRPRAVRALLKKAGKQATRDAAGGRRKLCVVESGCLGPCPKRAIAVATGASLAAGRVILLDPGAEPAAALAAVLHPVPSRRPPPEFGPNTALAPVSPDESPPPP
ncbi:hypothetical protein MKK88_07810 [Methylobacterium sp. E-005]|uniref:hypothetical protein n=1 Tax=Methylobacterium sp. E-005 TaxID=2836549 RepID=UPI001FBAF129|nr:hypothetical protein [Methylobacterium sp. E-005]MCJ2085898.1 hypothetical protein [Methylobacterium sp. E-005]